MIFQQDELRPAFFIIGTLVVFYAYYYFAHSSLPEKAIQKKAGKMVRETGLFFIRKFSGFLILGVIPAFFYFAILNASGEKFGLTPEHFFSNFYIIAGMALLIASVLYFNYKSNRNKNTLQMNLSEWNLPLFLFNALGWSIYLFAYEFLFRGILLFECYESFGFWPALAINVTLYSAIHMVNGKDQAIGALIFGSIASYFAITRGTLIIPIAMHVSLSILSDYFSIRLNPNLRFVKHNIFNLKKL
jgi:membrane protease YdiL (CAAX protease family)